MIDLKNLKFIDLDHERFFVRNMTKRGSMDPQNMALWYCLGISEIAREHIDHIYDAEHTSMRKECLQADWQTDQSRKAVRLAFHLFNDCIPDLYGLTEHEQIEECREYSVNRIFDCEFAPFFWEAVKIRFYRDSWLMIGKQMEGGEIDV